MTLILYDAMGKTDVNRGYDKVLGAGGITRFQQV
jgi:hypothetical protein